MPRAYFIDHSDRAKLERMAKWLYLQERPSADEMRDAAHILSGIVAALIPADE